MDIGDFGYIIFLVIVGIANLLRARNKQKEAKKKPTPHRGTRTIPVPQEPEDDPYDGRYHRDASKTGTTETASGEGRYQREPAKTPVHVPESPEPEIADWREMMTEMLEGEARQDIAPTPIPAAVQPVPVPEVRI